jgi:SNF2 family DNA or RNA helicase
VNVGYRASISGNPRSAPVAQEREAARFCPDLRSLVLHGKDRHEIADSMHDHDIVITPYSLMERDRERWLKAKWHLVVLDEAQNIKNASTQAAQVVKLVAQGTIEERILGLQERKAALAESMYSGSVGRKQPLFSESDLAELLKQLLV